MAQGTRQSRAAATGRSPGARMRRSSLPRPLRNYDDTDDVDIPEAALGPGKTGTTSTY